MIKRLQKKFIIIAMSASIIITCTIFGLITIENYRTTDRQIDGILNLISENDGKIPEYRPRNDELTGIITKETQFSTRYFFIRLNNDGQITETNMQYIASVEAEDVDEILNEISEDNKEEGYYENYKYKITTNENGKLIIFLDCSMQLNNLKSTTEKAIMIIIIGLLVVFVFISILSKKVLSPIIKNIEKQKQFITNAGHELKTPVAVIIANADVIEMTSNENIELIKSIKNQANKLDILIKSLLNLANIEERNIKTNYEEFSITEMIKKEIQEFKALSKNKKIIYDDSKETFIKADINSIMQLITILLDNAIKYTPDDGLIEIKTEKQGKNTKIQISNTCENAENIDTKRIFDRFYREDKSRNKSKDGYGIGLSIAKSIVDMHKGKITVNVKNETICFTITI